MTMKLIATAAASAALTVVMGASAFAAEVGVAITPNNSSGVSLVERGHRSGVKDMVVEAGTDPASITLHFTGAQMISIGDVGTLLIVKQDGSRWRYKPDVYQVVDGKRKPVTVAFHFIGIDRVSLRVGKLNSSAPLVFGPVS